MSKPRLTKRYLEYLYQKYNKVNSANDPIWNILIQKDKIDQEILAFISAIYAFGNVSQINKSLVKIFELLTPSALSRILDYEYIRYIENQFVVIHRFLFHQEFITLLKTLNKVYTEHNSLKNLFLQNYNPSDLNLKSAIIAFSGYMRSVIRNFYNSQRKIKFIFPSPENRSSCKRINLFLRWMVRKDNIDLGLWNEIKTSQLVIPLDVHIYKLARHYNLTKLKSPSWNMAVEITESLKEFDPQDPIKYDFALSHLEI